MRIEKWFNIFLNSLVIVSILHFLLGVFFINFGPTPSGFWVAFSQNLLGALILTLGVLWYKLIVEMSTYIFLYLKNQYLNYRSH